MRELRIELEDRERCITEKKAKEIKFTAQQVITQG